MWEFIINLIEIYEHCNPDSGILLKSRRLLDYIHDIQKFIAGKLPKETSNEVSLSALPSSLQEKCEDSNLPSDVLPNFMIVQNDAGSPPQPESEHVALISLSPGLQNKFEGSALPSPAFHRSMEIVPEEAGSENLDNQQSPILSPTRTKFRFCTGPDGRARKQQMLDDLEKMLM